MRNLTAEGAAAMIRLAAERLRAEASELSRLDAASGDGDHGANVETAFGAAERRLRDGDPSTPAEVFRLVASTWANSGGGASAAVFATFFDALATGVDTEQPSATNIADGFDAASRAIQAVGRAAEGDKTLLDALVPAARAARSAIEGGGDIAVALRSAASASELGAAATAEMQPKAGRARYASANGRRVQDPGATTIAIMLGAWADAAEATDVTGATGLPPRAVPTRLGAGLDRVATPAGQFAILALDHVRSFAATMRPDDPDSMTAQAIWEWKAGLIEGLASAASAVLIDPGFAASRPDERSDGSGLIVGLEDSDYGSVESSPRLLAGWTVERAARLGADAIKVSFGFVPGKAASGTDAFVSNLVRECADAGIPLLCEPLADLASLEDPRGAVVDGVRRFGALGVDVLKIQFPFDTSGDRSRAAWADACAEVDEASAVPWALLSEGREFDEFRELLGIACRAGASGFVAGRAIWGVALDQREAIRESAHRLSDLRAIATANARPWRAHRRSIDPTDRTGRGAGQPANAQEVLGQTHPN